MLTFDKRFIYQYALGEPIKREDKKKHFLTDACTCDDVLIDECSETGNENINQTLTVHEHSQGPWTKITVVMCYTNTQNENFLCDTKPQMEISMIDLDKDYPRQTV
jgi:hypothetical protein